MQDWIRMAVEAVFSQQIVGVLNVADAEVNVHDATRIPGLPTRTNKALRHIVKLDEADLAKV